MSQERSLKHAIVVGFKILLLTAIMFVLFSTVYTLVGVAGDPALAAESTAVGGQAPASQAEQVRMAGLLVGVCFLQTVVLSIAILRSRWSGWKLILAMFTIMWMGTAILSHIDTLFFLDELPRPLVFKMALASTLLAAVFSPIAVWVLGRARRAAAGAPPSELSHHTRGQWALILAALAVLHIVLYFVFGYYVAWQSPELRAFYGGEDPGSFWLQMKSVVTGTPMLIPVQVVRGLLWGLLAVILASSLTGSRWSAGVITAAVFVVVFALPLVFPNPFMPDAVRQAHLVETVLSRGLYGFLAVWFLRSPMQLGHPHPRPA